MNWFFYFSIFTILPISTAFLKNNVQNEIPIYLKPLKLNPTDINKEIEYIQKYKEYFDKESYNDVIYDIVNNKFNKIFINHDYNEIISVNNYKDTHSNSNFDIIDYHITNVIPLQIPNIVEKTSEHNVPIFFDKIPHNFFTDFQHGIFQISSVFLSNIVPIYIGFSLISFIYQIVVTRNSQMPNTNTPMRQNKQKNSFNLFGNMKNDNIYEKPVNISLSNWAGSPEVIDECKEVIKYIENKELYKQIGAEMPKGFLLEGPPGTGKTLLAKAIASETNSTFISMSGSEFTELFVGMGALRVRELFKTARDNRPSIIFIDEIDAVGRQRGAGINMANDEREQTLNQLLYEMDGFNNNDDIVIIAATNRKDILDQALLRPGRFDRIIRIPYPDKESRKRILELYLSQKPTESINIDSIAEITEGFSGAKLKNLVNEAAILSIKNNYTKIHETYLFDAFEKSIVGLIKKNTTLISEETKKRVAIHESGHAILALNFKDYFDFKKVSIQPTYNGAGGYTIFSEKPQIREGGLYTKDLLFKRLIITLGGKAAESIVYGNNFVSVGAFEDLRQANQLAQKMIGNFGMGNDLEVFFNEDLADESNPFLGRSLSMGDKYSQYTKQMIDYEYLELVKHAYEQAKIILSNKRDSFYYLTNLLLDNITLTDKDIEKYDLFL